MRGRYITAVSVALAYPEGGGDPKPVAQIFDNVFKTFEIVLELFWCLITLLYSNFTTHARVGLRMLVGKYACV